MTDKLTIILGKGPSARFLKPSDKYNIATINNALWMCDSPTWAFITDLVIFEIMDDDDFKKVKTMVVPSFLQSWGEPSILTPGTAISRKGSGLTAVHFQKLYEFFPDRFNHIEFKVWCLYEGQNEKPEELGRNVPPAPQVPEYPQSTTVTAIWWLSSVEKVKDFILMGNDPSGGYHPYFTKESPKFHGKSTPAPDGSKAVGQAYYQATWNQSLAIAKKYNVRLRHINDIDEDELNSLGILKNKETMLHENRK